VAVTVPRSSSPSAPPGDARRTRNNFETWQWYFMRVSGLILVFLALGHFTMTHVVNDVADTNLEFVQDRWANPLWRVYDWSLLALALFHGLNGMRVVVDDYVRSAAKRTWVKSGIYALSIGLFAYGTLTIVTF